MSLSVLGVETAVFESGSGPDVLFLHGNPDTHHAWSPVIERLAPKHRCIAPDLPGYGESRAPADFDFSIAHQGEWVRALVSALGLSRVHLVVHDVGGPYGLSFAAQHPKMVRSLTIFNTLFSPDVPWHFWARVWRTPIVGELTMKFGSRALFVREMLKGSPKLGRAYAEEAWWRYTPETRRQVLRWYRAMNLSTVLAGWDVRLRDAIQDIPRRVVWGERDIYIPSWVADRFGAPVHRVADCGHWPMLESPDEAARLIAELVE
jgi:pimeloyl-ACP methyl ester carboxylesterase